MVRTQIKAWLSSEARDCLRVLLLTALVMLFMSAAAVGLPLVLGTGLAEPVDPVDTIVMDLELTALLGLCAGAASRLILRKRTPLLQLAASSAGVLLGLVIIAALTRGELGFPLRRTEGVSGVARLLGGFMVAWLPLAAFRRNRAEKARLPTSVLSPSVRKNSGEVVSHSPGMNGAGGGPAAVKKKTKETAGRRMGAPGTMLDEPDSSGKPKSTKVRSLARTSTARSGKPKSAAKAGSSQGKDKLREKRLKKARRRTPRNQVLLKGVEDHRCPYCLESVIENDPRGVKVCPVCRTWHHEDCWKVTGTCQVPHKHA